MNAQQADNAWADAVRQTARRIRRRGLDYVIRNNGGYLSQICSAAEMLAYLYLRGMRLGPSEAPMIPRPFTGVPGAGRAYETGEAYNGPRAPDLDRFIFSPAHYALVLYVTLIETGRMAPEGLEAFNRDGSTVELIGAEHSPGIATTTGSLSQALSQAGGIALGRRLKGESGRVWVMMSDGEFQEGQTWEAVQALAFYGLSNLRVVADVNGQQCDGPMDEVMSIEPLAARLEAFGAAAVEVDGHDVEAIDDAAAADPGDKPLFILARTDPARGIAPLAERERVPHSLKFTSEDERERYRAALESELAEA